MSYFKHSYKNGNVHLRLPSEDLYRVNEKMLKLFKPAEDIRIEIEVMVFKALRMHPLDIRYYQIFDLHTLK